MTEKWASFFYFFLPLSSIGLKSSKKCADEALSLRPEEGRAGAGEPEPSGP
jgi:hypothetical protein